MMRYAPLASVTVERTRSMIAGLSASTTTPGRTAPDESVTTPVTVDRIDCAYTPPGTSAAQSTKVEGPAHPRRLENRFPIVRLRDEFPRPTRKSTDLPTCCSAVLSGSPASRRDAKELA